MHDTSEAAAAIQLEIQRKLTGVERLRIALDLSQLARDLSMARLRLEHPAWSDTDLKRELVRYAFLSVLPPRPRS